MRTVFRNASLLDGEQPAQPRTSIAVDGNRIVAVGPDAAIPSVAGERSVDLRGKTLMPGMVQSHFHTTFSNWAGGAAPQLGLERPAPLMTVIAEHNLETALSCGFTSVVCSSTPYYIDRALVDAMQLGLFQGPRVAPGSHEIMVPGTESDPESRNYYMGLTNHGMILHACGADEFRRVVRTEVGRGAAIVKVAASGGHALGGAEDVEVVSPVELEAAARAAHGLGARIRAHAASRRSILDCARAGFDIIDHADRLDDECIEAILRAGSTIVPSMLFGARFLAVVEQAEARGEQFDWGSGLIWKDDEYERRLRAARDDFANIARMLPIANGAGVKIAIGDDFGVGFIPHGDYVSELELYVKELGISALDVLRWATRNGAALMGLGDELGTIAEGKLADLLVVDGDPLADIGCLGDKARLRAIVRDGEFVKDELAD